jgi:hypothetical protein
VWTITTAAGEQVEIFTPADIPDLQKQLAGSEEYRDSSSIYDNPQYDPCYVSQLLRSLLHAMGSLPER